MEKVQKSLEFQGVIRVFSGCFQGGCFQGIFRELQGVFPYALSWYWISLWTPPIGANSLVCEDCPLALSANPGWAPGGLGTLQLVRLLKFLLSAPKSRDVCDRDCEVSTQAGNPCDSGALFQGPLNRGVSNGGFSRSRHVFLFCPLFSFWDFPDFFGIFPICPGHPWGIFPICPFPLSRPINSAYEEQSRKGLRHNLELSRNRLEIPRFSIAQLLNKDAHCQGPRPWGVSNGGGASRSWPVLPVSAGPKRGCLNVGAWNAQEGGRKAPLSCNAVLSMLQCSFLFVAAQLCPVGDFPEFSRLVLLVFLGLPISCLSAYEEQSRKGPRHNLDLSWIKWENPPSFESLPVYLLPTLRSKRANFHR